jgi:hypothetical protein
MLDRDRLSAARAALGMSEGSAGEKQAGAGSTLKKVLPIVAGLGAFGTGIASGALSGDNVPTAQEPQSEYSPEELQQFRRHGLDPGRLRFIQSLNAMRQGMNLNRKLFEQALAGKLPADVLGGGGDEESDLEPYA